MNGEYVVLFSAVASLASLIVALYSYRTATRTRETLQAVVKAASLNSRIARALSKARDKPRRRYIVFRVEGGVVDEKKLERAILETASKVLGAAGVAASGIRLVYFDEEKGYGILRVRSDYKYHALAILGLVRSVNGGKILLVPVSTSGTIKSALRRARKGP